MGTEMFVIVPTPFNRPPRGATLLRSANLVTDLHGVDEQGTADDWLHGLRYQPDACGQHQVGATGICGSNFVGWDDPAVPPDVLDYVPPFVAAGAHCSTISGQWGIDYATERAKRLLDQCETVGIARELWRGDVAQAATPDLPNAWLAEDGVVDVLAVGAVPLVTAFAWLEAGIASCSCGGIGMIHASPFTATLWRSQHLVERTPDGRLVSALGTIVVADPGYDGSSPAGHVDATNATAWAYGTTMVDVRRGDVMVVGDRSTMDRSTNDFTVYAAKPFAATFDPCCHVGIEIDNTTVL